MQKLCGTTEQFDAVLCDLMLPDMTGVDIYNQAPAHMRGLFVFCTGTTSGPVREKLDALSVPVLLKGSVSNDEIFGALEKQKDAKPLPKYHYDASRRRMTRCQSDDDGDCTWKDCPQLRDDEPKQSGRHCPLDTEEDDD